MRTGRQSRTARLVVVATLSLAATGMALEGPEGDLEPRVFGGHSPLVLPASAFTHDGQDADAYHWNTNGFWGGKEGSSGCLRAPVQLPQGAWLYGFWASFLDRDADENGTVSLVQVNNTVYSSAVGMALVTSENDWDGDNGNDFQPDLVYHPGSITNNVITYPERSYFVDACFSIPDIKLFEVWINYIDHVIFVDDFETGNTSHWSSITTRGPGGTLVAIRPGPEPSREAFYDPDAMAHRDIVYDQPLAISAAAFRPNGTVEASNPSGDYGVVFEFDSGYWRGTSFGTNRYLTAPFQLPDGATINDIYINFYDADDGAGSPGTFCADPMDDMEFWVYRSDKHTANSEIMAQVEGSGVSSGGSYLHLDGDGGEISNRVMDNMDYSYYLQARLCSSLHRMKGVLIYYTK